MSKYNTGGLPDSTFVSRADFWQLALVSFNEAIEFNILASPEDLIALQFVGEWSAGSTYHFGDVVYYEGSSFAGLQTGINKPPAANPTYWQKMAAKGETGATGPAGPKGEKGESGVLGEESVETKHLKNLNVTAAKLGEESVETAKLKNLNVTAAKLAAEAVETSKIKLLAITEALLAAEAVGEGKIKNLAVTSGKLAAEAVTEGKLATNAVVAAKIAANAVTETKIAEGAVTETRLAEAVKTKLKGATIVEHSFAIVGKAEAVTYRGFYVGIASGETKKLVGMKYSNGTGTTFKFSIKQNGTAVSEFKEKESTTTAAEVTGKSVSLANGDRIDLTGETVTGEPKDVIVTLWLESTH